MNFNMQEFQDKLGQLIIAHEQKQELAKEKKKIDKQYKNARLQVIKMLQDINQNKCTVDGFNNKKYEIELKAGKKTKGVRATERDQYIDNIIQHDLDPEELAQSLKDALQGDVEYVDALVIKQINQ